MSDIQNAIESRAILAKAVGALVRAVFFVVHNVVSTVRQRKLTIVFAGLLLVLLSAFSVAQTTDAGDVAYTPTSLDEVTPNPRVMGLPYGGAEMIQSIFGTMDTKLKNVAESDKLGKFRDAILAAGLIISLLWAGVKTMMAGKGIGELLGEWIPVMMAAGVVMAFTTPGPGSVGYQIVSLMDSIASALTLAVGGTQIDTSSIAKVAQTAASTTYATVMDIFTTPQQSSVTWNPVTWVSAPFAFIFRVLISAVTAFFVVISMCVYLATAIMAMVSISLVVALAPVMVPFLVFKPMSWLFESWLRFLLGACMLKLVGAFMLALTSGLFTQMRVLGQSIAKDAKAGVIDSYNGDIILYLLVLMVSVLAGLLMAQVPSIASGLMSGSAGGAGFSSLKGVTQTMGARMAGAGVAKAANYSADKFPKIGREALAEKRGASDLAKGINTGGRESSSTRAQVAYARGRGKAPKPPPDSWS